MNHHYRHLNQLHRPSRSDAFSLIEMLVVIAIVAIGMGMLANTQLLTPRPKHAVQMAAGTVEAARAEAITAGLRTRVAICVDQGDEERHLRELVSLSLAPDDNGSVPGVEEWLINSIRLLPEGTAFMKDFSHMQPEMKLNTEGPVTVQSGNEGASYVFIEFDGLGQCQSSSQWVFTRAIFDSLEPVIPSEMDRDGFIVRKTGKLAYFHTPEQITSPSPTTGS